MPSAQTRRRWTVSLAVAALAASIAVTVGAAPATAAVADTVVPTGLSAPRGAVWLPGPTGGHLWVADGVHGLCRIDGTAPAAALSLSHCTTASTGITGQVAYDALTHTVYIPDASDKVSTGVWRATYSETDETLQRAEQLKATPGVEHPTAVALGPDGALYVAPGLPGTPVKRITDPANPDVGVATVEDVAATSDAGPVHSLAFVGADLYLAQDTAVTVVRGADTCTGGCTAVAADGIVARSPRGLTADGGALYVVDTPLATSYLLRVHWEPDGTPVQDLVAGAGTTGAFRSAGAVAVHDGAAYVPDDPARGLGVPAPGRVWRVGLADAVEQAGAAGAPAAAPEPAGTQDAALEALGLAAPTGVLRLGTSTWVADGGHGLCPLGGSPAGAAAPWTLDTARCFLGALAAGAPAYDAATNTVFVPDASRGGLGILRALYDPAADRIGTGRAILAGTRLAADQPLAAVLGPDGDLYVVVKRSNVVYRVVAPLGDEPQPEVVGRAAGVEGATSLAFVGGDLYLAEFDGVTVLRRAAACVLDCVAAPVPGVGVDGPSALASDQRTTLYAADTPTLLSRIVRYTPASGAREDLSARGVGAAGGAPTPLRSVTAMSVDSAGRLRVADQLATPPVEAAAPPATGRLWQVAAGTPLLDWGPPPETPSAPALDTVSDTGLSPLDDITRDTTPTFVGTGRPGTTVRLLVDGRLRASGDVAADGIWSITLPAVPDGSYAVTAYAMNGDGVRSATTPALQIVIDTVAPAEPPAPALAPGDDTGLSPVDGVTRLARPRLTGGSEAGARIDLVIDGTTRLDVSADAAGDWTTPLALADGAHAVETRATDAAGNASPMGGSVTVTVDTKAPAAPGRPTLDPASDTGVSHTDGLTRATDVTLTGTAEDGTQVTVTVDGTAAGSADAADGRWALDTTLTAGRHALAATAADLAGNTARSLAGSAIVDTTAPSLGTLSPFPARGSTLGADGSASLVVPLARDALGLAAQWAGLSTNAGRSWTRIAAAGLHPAARQTFRPRTSYLLGLSATDRAGNLAGPAVSAPIVVAPVDDTRLTYRGRWWAARATPFFAGTTHATASAGANAGATVRGRWAALVATVGPDRGIAQVYVDGRLAGTVDLYRASVAHRAVALVVPLSAGRSHTVTVRATGTRSAGSRGAVVDVDTLLVVS